MFGGTIYKITNSINGKIYIGQTTKTAQERLERHKRDARFNSDMAIHRAIRKYGEDQFATEVLIDRITSQEELNNLEERYIKELKSYSKDIGYNIALGGYSGKFNITLDYDSVEVIVDIIKNTDRTFTDIGKQFGVSISTISDINKGKTWSNYYPGKYPISTYGYKCKTLFGLEKDEIISIDEL